MTTEPNRHDRTRKTYLKPGDVAALLLPWSEVCMRMRVQDKVMYGRLLRREYQRQWEPCTVLWSVQLYSEHNQTPDHPFRSDLGELRGPPPHGVILVPYSSPITCGEAGLYLDERGWYHYPPVRNPLRYERLTAVELAACCEITSPPS